MPSSFNMQSTLWKCFSLAVLLLLFSLNSCQKLEKKSPLFQLMPVEQTHVDFRNQLFESNQLNIIAWEYFYNGGGVGIGDFDNDSLPDIFFAGNMVNSRIYKNLGNFSFEDKTKSGGLKTKGLWASGVSLVDINTDGLLDVYVCLSGPYAPHERHNQLYINKGDFTFEEKAKEYGLDDNGYSTQAVFFDYDKDGDLDCYILTNMMGEIGPNVIREKINDGSFISTDRLYRNDRGKYVNVSKDAGILKEGYGLGVSVCDINGDNWPDLYVSNDYLSNDLLWINQQDGTFTDKAYSYFKHTSYSAMGHDVGDINQDGKLDILTLDMLPATHRRQKLMFGATNYDRYQSEIKYGYQAQFMRNTLQLHQGYSPDAQPLYAEISQLAGVHQTDWSWSALFSDIDRDGQEDILISNGYPRDITNRDFVDYKAQSLLSKTSNQPELGSLARRLAEIEGVHIPNYIFRNKGNLQFEDKSADWGFTQNSYSHGMALGDLDLDGDLDIVVNNLEEPAFIYQNHSEQFKDRHWLGIRLKGPKKNPNALGAKVKVSYGSQSLFKEHNPVRGYQSTQEHGLWFGLGTGSKTYSIEVIWPDDKVSQISLSQVDRYITLSHDGSQDKNSKLEAHKESFLKFRTDLNLHTHKDPIYPDFKVQPLLPHKHSQLGPKINIADVNKDGKEDFFIGGAYKESGKIFIQNSDGSFQGKELDTENILHEDVSSLFLDVDGDGDKDLYVQSGSSEFAPNSPYYQDRLYFNDGKGNFKLDKNALPKMLSSGGSVVALDFDKDGDEDIFVGNRLIPHNYPESPQSYLLENTDGKFKIMTEEYAPELQSPGMISMVLAVDMDKNGWQDLVFVGEWMPVSIAYNRNGRLDSVITIPNTSGWWNTIVAEDFDKDGDIDLVGGNLGWNSRLKASPTEPSCIYVNDFNEDGNQDAIMCYYLNHEEVPFHSRDDMLLQINDLRRRFPNYESFATSTWKEVFSEEQKVNMKVLKAQTFTSTFFENQGDGSFISRDLPVEAQFAPIYAILPGDFNQDGLTDILLSGNSSMTEVQTGKYDALNGLMLAGDGKGGFDALQAQLSGLSIPGEGRDLKRIKGQDGKSYIIASQNDDKLLIFEENQANQ